MYIGVTFLRGEIINMKLLCTDGWIRRKSETCMCLLWPASPICSVCSCHQCSKAQGNVKEIAVHDPVPGSAMDDITPASVILLRHLQAQSVPKPKGVKVQLIRKSDIIYEYLCGHKEHRALADGKGNCIQSRKQPPQNDHWNHTGRREPEIVCYRKNPR